MSVEQVNDENTSIHTEAYYEELASQEEPYLEETEEEVTRDFNLLPFTCNTK